MNRERFWNHVREWFRFEAIRHAPWEILLLRCGLAYVAWGTLIGDSTYTSQPHPNGVAQWVDLTFLSDDRYEFSLRTAARWSLVAFVFGVPSVISLLLPVWLGIGLFTLKNSQGAIGHSYQVVHLCLLAVWLAGVFSLLCRWRKRGLPWRFTTGQLEIDWARQVLAAGYVGSAITKLIESNGLWFRDSHYFALHLIKNQDMKFYGTLDEGLRRFEWLPEVMMQNPLWSQLFFGIGLPLELFAFLGAWNRRLALVFGVSLLGFHYAVKQLTLLDFEYNIMLLIVLMIHPLWWLVQGVGRLRRSPKGLRD